MADEKTCSACGETKPLSEFYKSKGGRFGVKADCKVCRKVSVAQWAKDNPEKAARTAARGRERNRETLRLSQAQWRRDHPDSERAKGKKWRLANPDTARRTKLEWAAKNPEKVREILARRYRKRRADPKARLEDSVSSRVRNSIVDGSKFGRRTFDILGYTSDDLRAHLEAKFTPGMTWENYGRSGWHVDHILPLAFFEYETPDDPEFKLAWALTNLQPLWEPENIAKRDRLDHPSQIAALAANDNRLLKAA